MTLHIGAVAARLAMAESVARQTGASLAEAADVLEPILLQRAWDEAAVAEGIKMIEEAVEQIVKARRP